MLYKNAEGVENEVFMIHSVEERDHHTISLSIDRPSTQNKHIIGREAYQFHKPHVKDFLVIGVESGQVSIVTATDLESLGSPVVVEPTLETPNLEHIDEPKITSGLSSTTGAVSGPTDNPQSDLLSGTVNAPKIEE